MLFYSLGLFHFKFSFLKHFKSKYYVVSLRNQSFNYLFCEDFLVRKSMSYKTHFFVCLWLCFLPHLLILFLWIRFVCPFHICYIVDCKGMVWKRAQLNVFYTQITKLLNLIALLDIHLLCGHWHCSLIYVVFMTIFQCELNECQTGHLIVESPLVIKETHFKQMLLLESCTECNWFSIDLSFLKQRLI